ncbi:T9SS type B sorting domain-containing protein [Flavobacterium mekongense]|uniref:T9SS type B sorting domain-containing protein n=1 Tax=Flavobacterium mekongense TaxID=3379707 RepID=UPI00399B2D36
MKKIYFYLFVISSFTIQAVFSQGANCASSDAFCAGGSSLTFQNSTGTTTETGIDYECLGSQPNPAWFYMQIGISGNINFQISQATNGGNPIDVDYIVWGPFATPSCGAANLNPATSVSCSFSAAAVENFTLPNAQVGQIYVVLLTNYSGQAGNITVTQTNAGQPGAGATDCNIVCPLSLDDQVICVGGQAILTATISGATSYVWTGPSGPIPGNNQSITVTQPGTYTVVVNKPGCVANATTSADVSYYAAPPINPPVNLQQCSNLPTFNLNDATANIFNGTGLNPGDFEVYFHTTQNGAQNIDNSIPNPAVYTPGGTGGTVYISVTDNGPTSSGCISVFSFTVGFDTCTATPNPPPTLTLCESSLGSGTAVFNFAPQTPIVLGTNSAADYTVTYHLTQNDADNDTGAIGPNNVVGTNGQTIYVRLEENANPLTYGTTTFQLEVNALPTATISGSTTICSGTDAVITFNGTPNATVTYTVDGGANETIVLDATGTNSITTPALTTNSTYTLVSVINTATTCGRLVSGSATVTVRQLPTATVSGTTAVCQNATAPLITFTGANGSAPYTFNYTINNVAQPPLTTVSGNSATVTVPTNVVGSFAYTLVSVESSGTPACSQNQTGTATVTVNPLPTATISGTISVCLNDPEPQVVITGANGTAPYTFTYTLNGGLPVTTLSSGNSLIINVPTTATGTFTYDLISVQDASATTCSQTLTGSATVTINSAPTIFTPSDYVVCDDSYNNDGFYCGFDLTTKINEITGGDPNIVVEFFETSTSGSPIASPYCNIDPGLQTIYVRAYNTGSPSCFSTTTFNLIVNPLPLANPVISNYELCDYTNPGDGVEVFTLNSKDTEIANGQSNVSIAYYESLSDAQTQTGALPNLYPNTSSPQEIWIVITNTVTGCNSISSFFLVVNPLPVAVTPDPIFQCSNGVSNQAIFDLTVNESVSTGGATGVVVTYHNSLAEAQNELSPLNALSYLGTDNETVYIRIEDINTGCYSITTQLLRVTLGPLALTPPALHYCDPNNDGFGVFNLEDATLAIQGGSLQTGVSVTYHETPTDALIGGNPLTSPYENINDWNQTIYVRVFYTLTGCANYVELELIVDPTPEATEPNDYELCDYTGAVGFESFDLTTTVPQILGSIDPLTHTVTFHTSLGDAQNDTGAITSVTGYVSATATLYVRVENNNTGCFDIVTLELIVNPLPNSSQPNYPQYTLCDYNGAVGFEVFNLADQVDDILLGQTGMTVSFYPSLNDAQNNTNEITNLQYQNQDIYVQTLGIRITNSTTGCYVISTMDIRVVPLPTPIPPTQPYTICDDNQDGYAGFDLNTLTTDILQGAPYIITYHETFTDAETGSSAIDTTVLYDNLYAFTQTLYVRAVDPNTGCVTVMPIVLRVNPSPIAPINLDNIEVCDQDNNTQNATTGVDLTVRTADVLAQQPLAASNYTVTYYTSSTAAQQGTSPIIPATNYVTTSQKIWVRVEDNNTGCYNIGSFDIIVNIPLLLTTPTPLSLCDDDANPNDQFHSFDLTVRDVMITQGLSGYTVTYYSTYALAQVGGASDIADFTNYTNVQPAVQTLGVRVTSAAGCYSVTTLDIRVLPIPTPNTNPPSLGAQCDYNNPGDMLEYFDLTVNAAYILNNDPNLTLEYYNSQADAINQVNPIINPSNALVGDVDPNEQSVWIRVENNRVDYLGNNCYVLVEQPLTVNALPTVATIADYQICEADPSGVNDGFEVFDLTSQITALMANNPTPPTYTVRFYEDAALTIPINTPAAYTNLTNPQTIYVQITNDVTTCRSVVGQFNILVNPKPTINIVMADMLECDYDGVNDGLMLYTQNPTNAQPSLAGYVDDILGAGQTAPTYLVEFYFNSQADADAGNSANALTNLDTYQVQTGTYWIRVTNTVTGCYQLDSFDVVIEQLAEPVITSNTGSNIACVNWNQTIVNNNLILDSGITAPNYTFNWYADGNLITGANSSTYAVTDINADSVTYTVEAVSVNPPLLGCVSVITAASTFEVVRSGAAANITYTVTNAFAENQIITVTNDGYGVYEYSLDDGPRQASNVFENVSLGSHTIYVWDVRSPDGYSCGVVSIDNVQVIDYPRYFTPNGDGFHDTWNVTGLQNFDIVTKIYIFDRYGKLLKQLSSSGDGWDGTYNGQPLPSTDYWFTVDYPENGVMKQFKAHFSLKR